MLTAHLLHADGRIEFDVNHALALQAPAETTVWVDLTWVEALESDTDKLPRNGRDDAALELLKTHWAFHPLAIEDSIVRQLRAKYERYPTHDFMVTLALDHSTSAALDTIPVCIFIRQRLVVTVRPGPVKALDTVKRRLQEDVRAVYNLDRLVHLILDAAVDEFMPLLDSYEDELDRLENCAHTDTSPQVMEDLVRIRRNLLNIRRILAPFQEVIRRYTDRDHGDMSPECRLQFRDVQDHILVLQDVVAIRLEICNGAIQSHTNATSERLNQVMKYLAVVSTMGLPMTVVSGVFGMNFDVIPIAHHAWGFFIALFLMFGSAFALVGWFRWRRWI